MVILPPSPNPHLGNPKGTIPFVLVRCWMGADIALTLTVRYRPMGRDGGRERPRKGEIQAKTDRQASQD